MRKTFTFTGARIDYTNPSPASIHIDDITHGLSNICRWHGQTNRFYSVAQHSVLLSMIVPTHMALTVEGLTYYEQVNLAKAALLHDAAEAYTGDIPSPIKDMMPDFVEIIEMPLLEAIFERFELSTELLKYITPYDKAICANEAEALFRNVLPSELAGVQPIEGLIIDPLPPLEARRLFYQRFKDLFQNNTQGVHHA
mgnify:CR=1 FL=1